MERNDKIILRILNLLNGKKHNNICVLNPDVIDTDDMETALVHVDWLTDNGYIHPGPSRDRPFEVRGGLTEKGLHLLADLLKQH